MTEISGLKSDLEDEFKRLEGMLHHIDLIITLMDGTKVDPTVAKDLLEHIKEEELEHKQKLQNVVDKMASVSSSADFSTTSSTSTESVGPAKDTNAFTVGNLFGQPQ